MPRSAVPRPLPRAWRSGALAVALPAFLACLTPTAACQEQPTPGPPALAGEVALEAAEGRGGPVVAANGMVVAGHPEATRIGVEVLRDGGNAVDAAVAVGFALAVTLPNAGNVGGGGFLLLRQPDGAATSLDFRETAPAAASRKMYLDALGEPVPGLSVRGHLAAGVPGTVAGLVEAHRRWGRLPLARLVEPAIRLADGGYVLTDRDARLLNLFRGDFLTYPSTARYFTKPDSTRYGAGERLVQRDLGRVLGRIRDGGRDGFYRGPTADLIVAEMQRGGGLITHADLDAYRPVERPVLVGFYRGHRVLTMGPPSTGGVALLQLLRAVEPYDLRALGFHSAEAVHLQGEAMRRAFADRSRWLGDPAWADVPTAGLTDSAYVAARMRSFRWDTVSTSAAVGPGAPPRPEGTETTHYAVVDADGRAAAVTYTINDYFGSKVVVDGAGFFLNDEMDDFAALPGRPNLFGLVQGESNAVRPGARPASSMTPTILEDPQGRLRLIVGSPGGPRIISTVFEAITHVLDYRMDVQTAGARPRFHHQWLPDRLEVEPGFPETQLDRLRARGWAVEEVSTFGVANLIGVEYDAAGRRTLLGGADPRRENDTAMGY